MKFLLLMMILSTSLWAKNNDLAHRPKSFNVRNGKAVFVDFISATYNISYDLRAKKAQVLAVIDFDMPEAGLPIFDSVQDPSSIRLNGLNVTATETKTPSNETTLRVVNQQLAIGRHQLVITIPLTELVEFKDGWVKSAFWTSDLSEREFLESYMPANLEYDRVKMRFVVKFVGEKASKQMIYTNGVVEAKDTSTYEITYPEYYNASSIFFHTVPEGSVSELRFSLKSLDGREIPAVVYRGKTSWDDGNGLVNLKKEVTDVFHELEGDYGAYPHPSIIVYNAGQGGMEYCGATMTSRSALGHEMFHFYFARGMMPANGNSGWLDEALASWRDEGYQSLSTLSGSSMMSNHPYYTRTTDSDAYSFGERFMGLLDGKLRTKGGIKPFMRRMIAERLFQPLFVEEFISEMSEFYRVSLMEDFKRYTYGNAPSDDEKLKKSHKHHQKLSRPELKKLL